MRYWVRSAFILWFAAAMTWSQGCATSQSANSYPVSSSTNNSASASSNAGTTSFNASAVAATAKTFDPSGYKVDSTESKALSDYLTQHKLPLVGAQVMKGQDGQRGIVLYGFVGSDFGKQDAVEKAQKFLGDSSVAVNNRIKVEPELLTSGNAGASSANSGENQPADENAAAQSYPGPDSYAQQQSEAQQYVQQQNTGSAISSMSPLLMLGMMALSMGSGGTFSVGPGSFGGFGSPGMSPFGAPAYNPYPGFPSPSPYGGGPAFGGGSAPYGSSPPYNPYGP